LHNDFAFHEELRWAGAYGVLETVRYVHAVLHRCLKEAVKRGLIGINPANGATLPRVEQDEMRILDEGQVIRFLISAQSSRYEALYHLAVKTGMRKAELLGLKWDDLDWQKGQLGFNGNYNVSHEKASPSHHLKPGPGAERFTLVSKPYKC
jgi:integrase